MNICKLVKFTTVGDHDNGIIKAHSINYAAKLQSKYKADNPTLIRIETQVGQQGIL